MSEFCAIVKIPFKNIIGSSFKQKIKASLFRRFLLKSLKGGIRLHFESRKKIIEPVQKLKLIYYFWFGLLKHFDFHKTFSWITLY